MIPGNGRGSNSLRGTVGNTGAVGNIGVGRCSIEAATPKQINSNHLKTEPISPVCVFSLTLLLLFQCIFSFIQLFQTFVRCGSISTDTIIPFQHKQVRFEYILKDQLFQEYLRNS